MEIIKSHRDLDVYKLAFRTAMEIFRLTREFPVEEKYSLTDQVRRSSRSVCTNIAEAWRKRLYPAAFVAKINDAEAEAAETQTWLDFSLSCQYFDRNQYNNLNETYDNILGKLVVMRQHPEKWTTT
jgi:four helix bundle protein